MLAKQDVIAQVAAYAGMCGFPCSKQELLQIAEEQQFPDEVLDMFEDLPNRQYTCEFMLVRTAVDVTQTESSLA